MAAERGLDRPEKRLPDGRFLPGTRPGPGRPARVVEDTYHRAAARAVTVQDWEAICRRAVADALDGDPSARTFVAAVVFGKHYRPLWSMRPEELGRVGGENEGHTDGDA